MTIKNIDSVLVIGSGPIVIGQAAEFDYAGTQACRALREEGVKSILLNSNPATIMTDSNIADSIYIEPLTVESIEQIIQREKVKHILGTLGGQTGLNLLVELRKQGVLERYGIEVLGTPIDTIETAEDRQKFGQFLQDIGEPIIQSFAASSMDECLQAAHQIGYPIVVRPAYTLGGTGGGLANNDEDLVQICQIGLAASRVGQVLIEKSLHGWKEIEYEVIRDAGGNLITVCNMENLDPLGVHTGDSIVVAPSQTLTDKDYQKLRSTSLKIIDNLGVQGACNVQFAYRPANVCLPQGATSSSEDSDYYIIEVNPRVSRSSALASKATGYPIARVATKIALGRTLDQIENVVTRQTTAASEPALDYCVVKIPRWPFDKFPRANRLLGTQMKSTGEVMAIDRGFEAALQKAIRSLDLPYSASLSEMPPRLEELNMSKADADDLRLWKIMAYLRSNFDRSNMTKVSAATGIDPWFVNALWRIVEMERELTGSELDEPLLRRAKQIGFSDPQIAQLVKAEPEHIRQKRLNWEITPTFKMVDTCAAEFVANTPYFYSTYETENEATPLKRESAIVLGSGPIRIGQGIEFDYSSVHAVKFLSEYGIAGVMINSNPETVSTDFDTSARLYFEPLDEESVLNVLDNESYSKPGRDTLEIPKVMVQYGGQTAINMSQSLGRRGLPVLGSSPEAIDNTSDRGKFETIAAANDIPIPMGREVVGLEQALEMAKSVGYPVLVRPSYVLGGRAMEIIHTPEELKRYFSATAEFEGKKMLISHFLRGIELEVDAVFDGEDVLIPGIMQHVEPTGVHSGDSICVYPTLNISESEREWITECTKRIGRAYNIRGLMNIQYVVHTDREHLDEHHKSDPIYVIEVNPRSSRTVPYISKVTSIPLARVAVGVMLGVSIRAQNMPTGLVENRPLFAVKVPVFSTSKLSGVDTYLGPEMKSTGEVMGIDTKFGPAMNKALLAAGLSLSKGDPVLLSIADRNKQQATELIKTLHSNGHKLYATQGTAQMITELGIQVTKVEKRLSQSDEQTVIDIIRDGAVKAVVNTVTGDRQTIQDGFFIRRAATERQVPCFTSIKTAEVAINAAAAEESTIKVRRMEEYLN